MTGVFWHIANRLVYWCDVIALTSVIILAVLRNCYRHRVRCPTRLSCLFRSPSSLKPVLQPRWLLGTHAMLCSLHFTFSIKCYWCLHPVYLPNVPPSTTVITSADSPSEIWSCLSKTSQLRVSWTKVSAPLFRLFKGNSYYPWFICCI